MSVGADFLSFPFLSLAPLLLRKGDRFVFRAPIDWLKENKSVPFLVLFS